MKFKSAHIPTTDNEIIEGREYAYSEGSFRALVKVLENNSDSHRIVFKLLILKSNRDERPEQMVFSVDASYHKFAFAGMWKLWDTERFEKWIIT